jgi:translation elongation factor EF-G
MPRRCWLNLLYKNRSISVSKLLPFFPSHSSFFSTVKIQCPEEALGGVYSCLNKRRAQVFSEERKFGTPVLSIQAYLPVAQSFGFNAEIRGMTSGQAFPQMVFDHWETMDGCECFLSFLRMRILIHLDVSSSPRKRK